MTIAGAIALLALAVIVLGIMRQPRGGGHRAPVRTHDRPHRPPPPPPPPPKLDIAAVAPSGPPSPVDPRLREALELLERLDRRWRPPVRQGEHRSFRYDEDGQLMDDLDAFWHAIGRAPSGYAEADGR